MIYLYVAAISIVVTFVGIQIITYGEIDAS